MSKKRKLTADVVEANASKAKVNISVFENDIKCGICFNIMHDPHMLKCRCKRACCESCLHSWLKTENKCPSCNVSIEDKTLAGCCRQWRDFLDALPRHCPNSEDCRVKPTDYFTMKQHRENTCIYRLVECPNEECGQTVPFKSLSEHVRMCRLKRCKNFRRKIDGKVYGCPNMGTQKEIKEHESKCHFTQEILYQIDQLCQRAPCNKNS